MPRWWHDGHLLSVQFSTRVQRSLQIRRVKRNRNGIVLPLSQAEVSFLSQRLNLQIPPSSSDNKLQSAHWILTHIFRCSALLKENSNIHKMKLTLSWIKANLIPPENQGKSNLIFFNHWYWSYGSNPEEKNVFFRALPCPNFLTLFSTMLSLIIWRGNSGNARKKTFFFSWGLP